MAPCLQQVSSSSARSRQTNALAVASGAHWWTLDAAADRTDVLTVFGLMLGTLQLARALTDRDLSNQLLARGTETALKLLDERA